MIQLLLRLPESAQFKRRKLKKRKTTATIHVIELQVASDTGAATFVQVTLALFCHLIVEMEFKWNAGAAAVAAVVVAAIVEHLLKLLPSSDSLLCVPFVLRCVGNIFSSFQFLHLLLLIIIIISCLCCCCCCCCCWRHFARLEVSTST